MVKKIIFFLALFSLSNTAVDAQSTPQQTVAMMGAGINLGNVLSAPYEGDWADVITEAYIDNISRMGFKTIRIPIRFDMQTTPFSSVTYTNGSAYVGSPSQYSVNTTYLNRINTILDWCTSRNLIAIIDVHGDHWFWGSYNPANTEYKTGNDRLAAIDRFKAIWRDISTTFKNKPDTVLFEIMNEAYFDMSATDVDAINAQILSIIRQTNPTRNIIVNGGGINSWEAPMAMANSFLQSDNHLIATFHYYLPFKFTHSASTTGPVTSWGSSTEKATVDSHFDQVKAWSVQKNIPVFLGEFGADNYGGYNYSTGQMGTVGPDAASRLAYHQYIADAARSRGFGFTVWDAGEKAGKTIYLNSSQTWVKDIRNAVLNSSCNNQNIINNANIGLNYDYSWSILNSNATATLNNSIPGESYQAPTLNVNVSTTSGASNNVVVSNDEFSSGFTLGQSYIFKFYAKGDNNQEVKLRVKKTDNNNVVTYPIFGTYILTSNYTEYTSSYTVDTDTKSLKIQLLCGKNTGNYYFDNFQVTPGSLGTVEALNTNNILLYPNPVKNYFEIKSKDNIVNIEIYSADGKKVKFHKFDNQYHFDNPTKGIYFVKVKTANEEVFKKIILD